MANTVAEKLKIKEGYTLHSLNAPSDWKKGLGELPNDVIIGTTNNEFQQIHWFVQNRAQMEKELPRVMKLLKPDMTVWVYYPKVTSKIQTDLTRDKGWDCLLDESNKLTWVSLISFDDTWSAFGFRAKTDADRKKDQKPKAAREILNWIDAAKKQVRTPPDLAAALSKHKKESDFFNTLSFTNKKEYVEWIVTAKREETRQARVSDSIERLGNGWKNPANR